MKKLICFVLCIAMLFSLGVSALAAKPETLTVSGEYTYCPALGFLDPIPNQTGTFTYSDEYFTRSGYEYNHALAVMTMQLNQTCFASATSAADGWDTAPSNFNGLVAKCGFTDIDANADAVSHPGGETIGAYAANKALSVNGKDYTLIVLGIRGHNYGGEWYSNFDMGLSGEHEGFADARDKVLSFLCDYVAKYDITGPVKLWMTGYSRAAITANMVGGLLDKGFSMGAGVSFDTRDLYCYTYETPQGVYDENARDAVFGNIHNILNYNDLVPLVSFSAYGHTRYGIDYYLPCRQYDANYATWKAQVDAILSKTGWMNILGLPLDTIDDFHYVSLNPLTTLQKSSVTQIEFYDEMLDALFDSMAPSREYYVNYLQADIMELTRTLLGVDTARLMNALKLFGQKLLVPETAARVFSFTDEKLAVDVFVDVFMEAMQEAECAGYNGDEVRAMLGRLAPKMLTLLRDHPDTVLTLLLNIVQILNAHFPELGLTWLKVTPAYFFEAQNLNYVNGVFAYNGDTLPDLFSDVKAGSWCYDAVKWASANGIAYGYKDNSFGANDVCTRAQTVTFLWRCAGSPAPAVKGCPFVDVSVNSPYYKAICWAYEKSIAAGTDKTHFSPDAVCTRAQALSFLWRYAGSPAPSSDCPFADVSANSPHYKAVCWAFENGIAAGTDKTHFSPDKLCTRAHIISFLYRCEA